MNVTDFILLVFFIVYRRTNLEGHWIDKEERRGIDHSLGNSSISVDGENDIRYNIQSITALIYTYFVGLRESF